MAGEKKSAGKSAIEKVDVLGASLAEMNSLEETLNIYKGQPLAILCARFNYRGILSHVGKNHCILANAHAVESSGASNQEKPSSEDNIGCSVVISLNAVELIYQPNWAYAPLE